MVKLRTETLVDQHKLITAVGDLKVCFQPLGFSQPSKS